MLQMNKRTAIFLSRMGARGVLGQALYDMAKEGKEFFVVSADLSTASGFDRIARDFPRLHFNAGIAEANMLGLASGLSSSGIPTFATTWSSFACLRIADQVRNYMGYMKSNLKLVGLDSGFENNRFGYTHTNSADIAIMCSIPNILVLAPSDGVELYLALYEALQYKGPVYIRLTGGQTIPIIHNPEKYTFALKKAEIIRKGNDVSFISYGSTLASVIDVANQMEEEGFSTSIINMHTIRPLDYEAIELANESQLIVTVEEHPLNGGLGSMVASYLSSRKKHASLEIISAKDEFTPAGSYGYALAYNDMTKENILDNVRNKLKTMGITSHRV